MSDSIENDIFVGREMPIGDCVGNTISMMVQCAHHFRFIIPDIQTKMELVQQVFHGLRSLDT
jgi:hypothetical protein